MYPHDIASSPLLLHVTQFPIHLVALRPRNLALEIAQCFTQHLTRLLRICISLPQLLLSIYITIFTNLTTNPVHLKFVLVGGTCTVRQVVPS
jgi:hypothetical protein